ncbi:MAG: class I SAM-dependent methyltransferase [Anaerolineales bacterium]|nr:class I SAM-dependent methyltransferase [Chloroflexota bacterium]MBL6983074.1 class I SAM-dependent methyltransferase [Anaerolineales bacterium]
MNKITWATPLYEFLRQCNASPLNKIVLDCGAGGNLPPLSLFYQNGYKTCGIEIAQPALDESAIFCRENDMLLNIFRGDMRAIPFEDQFFSFAYSFNAIMFMTKPDIAIAMAEIKRVLKPGGLVYVNFESVDDPDDSVFCETAPAVDLLKSTRFAKHEDNEADEYFENFVILRKQKSWLEKLFNENILEQVNIEYIARKI